MKAYVVDRHKGPLRLADLPEPTVGEHDVLVSTAEGTDAESPYQFRSFRIVDGVITEEDVEVVEEYAA